MATIKKLITVFFSVIFFNLCYGQVSWVQNKDLLSERTTVNEIGLYFSTTVGRQAYTGFDLTMKNITLGMGFYGTGETSEHSGTKSVYVHSYTRKQNGKTVTVKSHYRSKPNSGGTSGGYDCCEAHFGYWLPFLFVENTTFYSSVLVGVGEFPDTTGFVWGGGFKAVIIDDFVKFALTFKQTNLFTAVGVSLCI